MLLLRKQPLEDQDFNNKSKPKHLSENKPFEDQEFKLNYLPNKLTKLLLKKEPESRLKLKLNESLDNKPIDRLNMLLN